MIGNGNLEGAIKKQVTDFTIDCILSKDDQSNDKRASTIQQPLALNKVLNNNPWIPISPLAHFFNPSALQKKFSLPNFFTYCPAPIGSNLIHNLIKATTEQNQNHLYALSSSPPSSLNLIAHKNNHLSTFSLDKEKKFKSSKAHVYEKISCDTQISNNDKEEQHNQFIASSPSSSSIQDEGGLKCTMCSKFFESSESLDVHMKCHTSKLKHSCPHCEKQFSQLRNFKYHLSIHRGTKEFAAECPECGKQFNDKGYLSSHLKIHRNKKEHQCTFCPKSFNQRVAFNMHVRIHLGLKPHSCSECGKTFSRKMLLKQHQRTHSGEKPYKCSFEGCEKRFADRSNMILHFRLHSGIKPFACNLCPKRFSKKHHLGTHLNYHLNLKPYACLNPGCSQKFTQSSNMRTHMKKCPHRKIME